jgi:flagellar biosynthesis repressor protein FlbT
MGLKVELKPGERLILGDCLITNGDQRTRLLVEGQTPILREKDIMTPEKADTPAKHIYLAVQLMYTSRDPHTQHGAFFTLMRELVQAAPSTWPHMMTVTNHIMAGEMYKALKSVKTLISYEKDLLDHARSDKSVRTNRDKDRKSA